MVQAWRDDSIWVLTLDIRDLVWWFGARWTGVWWQTQGWAAGCLLMFVNCWILMYQQHHHVIEMCFPIRVTNVVAIRLDTVIIIFVLHVCISFEERERDKQTDRETFNMYKEHQTESYIRCDIPSEYSFIEKKLKVFQNFWMILSVTRFEPFGMFQTCWSFFRWQFHRWQTCPARSWSLPTRFGSGGPEKNAWEVFADWVQMDLLVEYQEKKQREDKKSHIFCCGNCDAREIWH